MSDKQLNALLSKLKDDATLKEKLMGAVHVAAALAVAREA